MFTHFDAAPASGRKNDVALAPILIICLGW
jgi:hypothetical protein